MLRYIFCLSALDPTQQMTISSLLQRPPQCQNGGNFSPPSLPSLCKVYGRHKKFLLLFFALLAMVFLSSFSLCVLVVYSTSSISVRVLQTHLRAKTITFPTQVCMCAQFPFLRVRTTVHITYLCIVNVDLLCTRICWWGYLSVQHCILMRKGSFALIAKAM